MNTALAALAAAQGGVFSRNDALTAGYTPGAMRQNLAIGRWAVLRRGRYVQTDLLAATEGGARHALEVAAAGSAIDANTVASAWSAARLHNLETLGAIPPGIWLACWRRGPGGSRRMPGVTLQPAALWPDHLASAYGVRVTSAARTGIDLARRLPFLPAVVVLDSVLRQSGCEKSELLRVLHDCQDWPGSLAAARAVAFTDRKSESVLETVGRVLMHRHGLPAPQTQVTLGDRHGRSARVDYWWREHMTVGEADGMAKYDGLSALHAEKRREEWLREMGYEVVRFTWDEATRRPADTAARFRAAFDRAAFRAAYEASQQVDGAQRSA